MKISDFRKLSNAVAKVVHTLSICFDKMEVEKILVSYDSSYTAELHFFKSYSVIEICILVKVKSSEVEVAVTELHDEILAQITNSINKLSMLEKIEQKNWLEVKNFNSSNDLLQAMSALTMFRDVICQFKK